MGRKVSQADTDRLVALALEGCSRAEIAEQMGLPVGTVTTRMGRLMRDGLIPKATLRKNRHVYRRTAEGIRSEYGKRLGWIVQIMVGLTQEQTQWLMDQVPEGGQVADALRGIVVDAYFDHLEGSENG
jgi:predicted ArsR family transcriptional regulator